MRYGNPGRPPAPARQPEATPILPMRYGNFAFSFLIGGILKYSNPTYEVWKLTLKGGKGNERKTPILPMRYGNDNGC